MRKLFFFILFLFILPSLTFAQWQIGTGDTTFKIPVQALDDTTPFDEKTDVGSLSCRRLKNGVDGACAGTSAEVSDANHPGLWIYTLAAGDVDTPGPLILRFTATDMKAFRSANQVGYISSNIKQLQGVDVPGLYNGVLVSVSGTTIGVASGHVIADDQFNNGFELVIYDSGGKPKKKSCISDSVDSGDTVITRDDISTGGAAAAAGNNYVIRASAACSATLFGTQTANITGNITGNLSGSVGSVTGAVGSVTGNIGGNVVGSVASVTGNVGGSVASVTGNVGGTVNGLTAVALKDLFDTNSTTTYGAAVAGSVVKEIVDNVTSGGGTVDANIVSISGDTTAADNLEVAFDGTGYAGGTTKQQVTTVGMSAAALKDFFDTSSTTTYGASIAGSVVKEIADNAAGGGGGGGTVDANIIEIGGVAIATPEIPGYLPTTDAGDHYGTAQSYGSKIVKVAAAENFGNNTLANNASIMVFDATTNKSQSRCICKNTQSSDDVELCEPLSPTPTGTLKYLIFKSPQCNLAKYPSGH